MKGFILAAGLGTRLKPWTDVHPKALAPVGGKPMLERVVEKMISCGIKDITVNVHHFACQITDFIKQKGWEIKISDESDCLLETGGALLHAAPFLAGDEPILVHNADILSDADLIQLENHHLKTNADATLLLSDRHSTRKLLFSEDMRLRGWHSTVSGEFKPSDLNDTSLMHKLAFSGIYIISASVLTEMQGSGWQGKFSIIDFMLSAMDTLEIHGFMKPDLKLLDIGKPDSWNRANLYFLN